MKKCLIIANGYKPLKSDVVFLIKNGYNYLICADGGANSFYELKMVPDIIIGDLDSVKKSVLDYFKKISVPIKKISRQSDTDVEKCIKHAIGQKFSKIILLGATGDRIDHSFCNLGIALKFSGKITVDILHQKTMLSVIWGNNILNTTPGETISLYGFNSTTKFYSEGLKYPLKGVSLPFGIKESTSNVALGEEVGLRVTGGKAFLVRDFKVMRKNGLVF